MGRARSDMEFKAGLDYSMSSRPARASERILLTTAKRERRREQSSTDRKYSATGRLVKDKTTKIREKRQERETAASRAKRWALWEWRKEVVMDNKRRRGDVIL